MLLLVASLAVGAYLVVGRRGTSSASSTDFVGTTTALITVAQSVPVAAQKVQRFLELHSFDLDAQAALGQLQTDENRLQSIAHNQSGPARQIADQAVTAGNHAIDAVGRFREAVAFSYSLSRANTAVQDLDAAIVSLQQELKAWSHQS